MKDPRSSLMQIIFASDEAKTESEKQVCDMFRRMIEKEAGRSVSFLDKSQDDK